MATPTAVGGALRSSLRICSKAQCLGSGRQAGPVASTSSNVMTSARRGESGPSSRRAFSVAARAAATNLQAPASALCTKAMRRSLHSLPDLPGNIRNTPGCEPLFSETTVKLIWEDWQGGLLNKLNDEVRGTQWEHLSVAETVLGTARDPHNVQAFNFASLALNNSFFMSGLKPKELPAGISGWEDLPPPQPPNALVDRIERDFESLAAFKLAFSSMAYGMAGSGYVWLVQDAYGVFGIVPTYGAGTVLIQNRLQREGGTQAWTQPSVQEKSGSEASSKAGRDASAASPAPSATAGATRGFSTSALTSAQRPTFGRTPFNKTAGASMQQRGEELYPLMCVSVHEHDWLPDYGMWGKEEYLMRFWECVDWQRVQRLHQSYNMS